MLLLNILTTANLATAATLSAATRSNPFHLAIRSTNDTYNGFAVSACQQGALISSLCITSQQPNLTAPGSFALNTQSLNAGILEFSTPTPPTNTDNSTSTWFPMNFWYDPYTNIVMGFFQPLDIAENIDPNRLMFAGTNEGYGENNETLVMRGPVLDDRLAPNWAPPAANATIDRWHVCKTWPPAPYQRTSVVWALGDAAPQNPTCVKVEVVRV
jgi:hypothetical protein